MKLTARVSLFVVLAVTAVLHADSANRLVLVDLPVLPSGNFSQALAINDRRRAVGFSNGLFANLHAVAWEDGRVFDLGTLPGGTSSVARDVNNRGQVVGESTAGSGSTHAVLWQHGTIVDLGTLPDGVGIPAQSGATAVNN